MTRVPVRLPGSGRGYEVLVGDGVRKELGELVRRLCPEAGRAAVVTQPPLAGAPWFSDLDVGVDHQVHLIGEGEDAKSPGTVTELCRSMAREGLGRSDVVVAVGGGMVSDVAGFAASVYHRGIRYINVATSLLAQVDAAIGGKTGVNLPEGKNLVGTFWQPAAVVCDTATLSTLPKREWACGRGEMAKYAFLGAGEPDASILDLGLEEQVVRCVRIKADVVGSDEREGGRRMVLNYGHTLAHALEAASFGGGPDRLRHGEAVAVGLVYAALLARRLGRIGDDRVALHRRVVAGFGLSAELPFDGDPEVLLGYMLRDKKARHDLTFVLDGAGGVETVRGVDPADALATLAEMGSAGR